MPRRAPDLIYRLPDIAILVMVAVIAISLSIIGRADLVGWILLPLAVFLVLFWLKEYRDSKVKAGSKERVAPETTKPAGDE
jgi:Ca2+/Na+ antiporter